MERVKKNSVTIIATQLEQALIALGLINIYMRYSTLIELLHTLPLTLSLEMCSHRIAKVIIIRYSLMSLITTLVGLISNLRMNL